MLKFSCTYFAVLIFALLQVSPANATSLDITFSGDGTVSHLFERSLANPFLRTVNVIQPDGKILFAGDEIAPGTSQDAIRVYRYNPDGTPDMTFGTQGTRVFSVGFFEMLSDIALQPDGKILISGDRFFGQSTDLFVVRLHPNGAFDTTFNGTGLAFVDIFNNSDDRGGKMVLQPDGKIVLVGRSDFQPSPIVESMVVVRFTTNGSLDPTFSGDGRQTVSVNPASAAYSVGLQSDNKIIVCGYSRLLEEDDKFTCLRLFSDGNLDTSFGSGILPGLFRLSVGTGDDSINELVILDDDKFLVTGMATNSTRDIGVARVSANGILDTTFGNGGVVITTISALSNEWGADIQVQPDGKFVILSSFGGQVAILRYNANGTVDNDFGVAGAMIERVIPQMNAIPFNLSIQSDGKFITSGVAGPMGSGDIRYFYTSRFVAGSPINSSPTPFDFDGDGKSDISIFRPSVGQWWYVRSSDGSNAASTFGSATDKIVPADFTGDGKTDIAFYRPSLGEWYVLRSEDLSFYSLPFGTAEDIPVPYDFDGDGKADVAVFRPSTNTWYIQNSAGGTNILSFGSAGDQPAIGDYDGDGKADIAIFRPSLGQWWVRQSSDGAVFAVTFGAQDDLPAAGQFTSDNKTDITVFRPSTGEWFVLRSEDLSYFSFPFGAPGDVPVPADYDGDGQWDAAIYRPSTNIWYISRSSGSLTIQPFGSIGDQPVPATRP